MKKKQQPEKTYSIQITANQIALIRGLAMFASEWYIKHDVTRSITEDGTVEWDTLYVCMGCHKGSLESVAAIPHEKGCIVPECEQEFWKLNEQFQQVEEQERQAADAKTRP